MRDSLWIAGVSGLCFAAAFAVSASVFSGAPAGPAELPREAARSQPVPQLPLYFDVDTLRMAAISHWAVTETPLRCGSDAPWSAAPCWHTLGWRPVQEAAFWVEISAEGIEAHGRQADLHLVGTELRSATPTSP